MKNLKLLFILSFFLFGCSKTELKDSTSKVDNNSFNTVKLQNQIYYNAIMKWKNTNSNKFKSAAVDNVTFDYSNLLQVTPTDNNTNALRDAPLSMSVVVANQVGYNVENSVNYGIGFYMYADSIANILQFKLETISSNIKRIHYYDEESTLLLSFELDLTAQTINVIYKSSSAKAGVVLKSINVATLGQNVADCMTDVYSQQGWVSVFALVAGAYCPATVAGIAVACTIHNILN